MDNYTNTPVKYSAYHYTTFEPRVDIKEQEELINKIKRDFNEVKQILNSIIDKNSTEG